MRKFILNSCTGAEKIAIIHFLRTVLIVDHEELTQSKKKTIFLGVNLFNALNPSFR